MPTDQTKTDGTVLNFDLHLDDVVVAKDIPAAEQTAPVVSAEPVIQLDLPNQAVTASNDTSWLQETPAVETSVVEPPVVQSTPVVEQKTTYVPNDKAFQETVDLLNQNKWTVGPVTPVVETPVIQAVTPVVEAAPAAQTLNLDDMIKTFDTPVQAPVAPQVVSQPAPAFTSPQVVVPAVASSVGPLGAIPVASIPERHYTVLKILALTFLTFVFWGFILKTMYPVEFDAFFSDFFGKKVVVEEVVPVIADTWINIQNELVVDITWEVVSSWDVLVSDIASWDSMADIVSDPNVVLSWTQLVEGGDMSWDNYLSGDHAAASGFDAFGDLGNLWSTAPIETSSSVSLITSLRAMAAKGEEYNLLGRKNNDSLFMKYGLFISKKANELALSLENGEQIDTQVVDNYIASFSWYLDKLQSLVNASEPQAIITPDIQVPPTGEIPVVNGQ